LAESHHVGYCVSVSFNFNKWLLKSLLAVFDLPYKCFVSGLSFCNLLQFEKIVKAIKYLNTLLLS